MKSHIYPLLLCVLIPFWVNAQSRKWLELPNLDQLPSKRVLCLMQDNEGALWYGTEGGGVCRDDGRQLYIFRNDAQQPDLLGSNNVACLAETERHVIIGTFHGAYVLNKQDFRIRRIEEVDDHKVDDILVKRNGEFLLTTNYKIYEFSSAVELLHIYNSVWKNQEKYVAHLYEDRNGRVWATQWNGGLLRLEDNKLTEAPWPLPVAPTDLIDSKEEGYLWIGTVGQGIVRYRVADGQVEPQAATAGSVCIDLQTSTDGNWLWSATMNDLLFFRADKVLTPQPTADLVPEGNKVLHRLSLDRQGHLLVAGSEPGPFVVLQGEQRLWFDNIIHDGNYRWFYRERQGVVMQDDSGERVVNVGHQLLPALTKRSGKDGIWATDGQTLYACSADSCRPQATFTARPLAMIDDGRGGLWFTTGRDIRKLDLSSGTEEMVLQQPDISALTFTADTTLWLASIYGKIFAYRHGRLSQDNYASNEQGDAITHLSVDSQGHLLVVSNRYIHRYDPTLCTLRQQSREAAGVYAIEMQETAPGAYWSRPQSRPTGMLSKWFSSRHSWTRFVLPVLVIALFVLGVILFMFRKRPSSKHKAAERFLRHDTEKPSATEVITEEGVQATDNNCLEGASVSTSSTGEATTSVVKKEAAPFVVNEEATTSVVKKEAAPSVVNEEAMPSAVKKEATSFVVNKVAMTSVVNEEAAPSVVKKEATSSVENKVATSYVVNEEATPPVENNLQTVKAKFIQSATRQVEAHLSE
ncbi:MAG: hypothetical protein K6C30_01655, partial [Bacteroidaceae bacterium]|nr:hypothetical protein [Bacteroidaceae bacterium]